MGVLEAIAITHQMAWGAKKYKKAMQNTYADILIRGSWRLVEVSFPLLLFSISLIQPELIHENLLNILYSDKPHIMTPITKYDFFLSDGYMYFSAIVLYIYIESALKIYSAMTGGYCIPKKP